MIVYFNGRFMPKKEVSISPDDRGFLFADGVYEVIRCYNGKMFKAEEHFERLRRSLHGLRIAWPDIENVGDICEQLLRENGLKKQGGAGIYMQVTRGAAPRKHMFPQDDLPPTVYASVSPYEPDREKWDRGVKVILAPDIRWARCDIKSLSLLPNVLASQQAEEQGAEDAVLIRDGAITEGSRTSFCAVFDGRVAIYPESNYTLGSITRGVVLELCRDLDIPVRQFPISVHDLKNADECMLLGTHSEVTPVVQVDDWEVADGTPGPVTRRLQDAYRELYSDY